MAILLKIILGVVILASIFFGRLLFMEYKLFNNNIEFKNTSLAERILVNGIIFILGIILLSISSFSLISILSNITLTLPF
jgi:hypothetical protein